MTLDRIETAVRAQRGNWTTLFRREGAAWQCILFPRHRLTEEEYRALVARLSAPEKAQELTVAERKVNALRYRAESGNG